MMYTASLRVGRKCRKYSESNPPNPGAVHLSVTDSGEYSHPLSKGGQAAAVLQAIKKYLEPIEEKTWDEETPFGVARHVESYPLWRTLYRTEDEQVELGGRDFLSEYQVIKEQPGRFWGLDEALGKQIMYCAWKDLSALPCCRAEYVPEMGNKARWITCSEYWVGCLQAPYAHLLIECMRFHPSVFSSFARQDQAWEALRLLCDAKYNPERHAVLSSDLKDATNAVQHEVARRLIDGFVTGFFGANVPDRPYHRLILSLLGERLVEFWDSGSIESHLATCGIFMGEPMAKPVLTLLNLSIEEAAFCMEVQKPFDFYTLVEAPWVSWRACHIGGDDHVAIGPLTYLRRITAYHISVGSYISVDKHGISRYFVKYTERVLYVRNFKFGIKFKKLDDEYAKSPLIDGMKVRLLERGESTQILRDQRNVAVGKSAQLIRTLEWLPKEMGLNKVLSIRGLFIRRMGELLPNKNVYPHAYAHIHLPIEIGGYGLGFRSELKYWLTQSPWIVKTLISRALANMDVKPAVKLLRTLNTNPSRRGIPRNDEWLQMVRDHLDTYYQSVESVTYWDISQKYSKPGFDEPRQFLVAAYRDGWLSHEDFIETVNRGNLFQELLLGREPRQKFNTRKFVDQYFYIRPQILKLHEGFIEPDWSQLDNKVLFNLIMSMNRQYYVKTDFITSFDKGHWDPNDPESETFDFFEDKIIEGFRKGLPYMEVGFRFVGVHDSVPRAVKE